MNILLCGASMGIGGAETHMLALAVSLSKRGHRVTVAAERGELCDELKRHRIRFIRVPLATSGVRDCAEAYSIIKKILRRWSFDVVHAHSRLSALIVGVVRSKEGLDFRFIVTAHARYKTTRALRLLSVWGDECIAVSGDIKKHLVKNYGVPREKIRVIPNGIDTEIFRPDHNGDRHSILFVSRLDFDCSKGAEILCRIAPRLCREFPEVKITIAGGGNALSSVSKLAEKANSAVGRECVRVIGECKNVSALMSEHGCVVGVSRVALEAMASEKPVVLFGNEGALGLFSEKLLQCASETNFTCRGNGMATGEGFLLSEIRKAFLLDKGTLKRICRFGRDVVEKRYSIDNMTDMTLAVYKNDRAPIRIVFGGYYGFGNLGDDSILSSLVSGMKRNLPGCRISALTHKGVPVSEACCDEFYDRGSPLSVLKALRLCDVYISGGGSLFQNGTSLRSLFYYCGLLRLADMMGKKCFIISNGIGPLRGRLAVRLTARSLLSADYVSVRDMDSFLKVLSITKGALCPNLSADPVFVGGESRPSVEGRGKDLLGCGARYAAVALNGRCVRENETAARAIGEFCRRNRMFPVFVSMDAKIDESSARRCANIGRGIYVKAFEAWEIRRILKSAQIAFGSRLHFLIFALLEGVPFVPLFSDPKVDAFSAEVLGYSALRIRAGDDRELLKRIECFVRLGLCEYDKNDAVEAFSARAEGDLSRASELCLMQQRKNAPKLLKKNDLSAIINCD